MADSSQSVGLVARSSEREVVWNFVRAEIESEVFAADYREALGKSLREILLHDQRDSLTDSDWDRLKSALRRVRPEYAGRLLDLVSDWWAVSVPIAAVPDLLIANHLPLTEVASNRKLGDYATALDRGAVTYRDTASSRYANLRPSFSFGRMKGLPIIASSQEAGPYVIVEGLTRLACLASKFRERDVLPSEISMILGLSTQFRSWKWA